MKQLVAEGLEQGAVGMSSGLTYTPGMYASDAELTELCRVVARVRRLLLPAPPLVRRGRARRRTRRWSPSPARPAAPSISPTPP